MRRAAAFVTAALAAIVAFAAAGLCVRARAETAPGTTFTAEEMESELKAFLVEHADRTSFTERERFAAEYIEGTLRSFGYTDDELSEQSFEVGVEDTEEKLTSQNVIATYGRGEKTVIIGAAYDNLYSAIPLIGVEGRGDEGVAVGASGTAVALALAHAFKERKPALDFSVKFVFFGASAFGSTGSWAFVGEYIDPEKETGNAETIANADDAGNADDIAGADSVMLMINVTSAGAEKVSLYSDETETEQSKLFIGRGKNYDTEFAVLTRALPLFPTSLTTKLNYSHRGLIGDHAAFFDRDIPIVSFFGVDLDTFSYYSPIPDTLRSFESDNPDYGSHMADLASLVYDVITDAAFPAAAQSFRTRKANYKFFIHPYLAFGAFMGVAALLAVAVFLISRRLNATCPAAEREQNAAAGGMENGQNSDNDMGGTGENGSLSPPKTP